MARRGHGRRKTQWVGFATAAGAASLPLEVSLTAGTAALLSFGSYAGGAAAPTIDEFTVTRTIGRLTVSINNDTALIDATVAVGCGVMRNEALVAGIASLPDPEDDPDFEWLYYGVFGLKNPMNALRDGPVSSLSVPFDVRGQRVVRSGWSLFWIAESEAASVSAMVGGRYLIKLP